MKKLMIVLLAVFLLAGCDQTNPEQTTASTTDAASQHATEGTQAAEYAWLPQPHSNIPYEEYLSAVQEDLIIGGISWIGADGKTEFFLDADADGFCVVSFDFALGKETYWTVPKTEDWGSYAMLLCDGIWAYGIREETDLIRIELLTGEKEVLFTADRMMCDRISANGTTGNGKNLLQIDHDWLYFLAKKEDRIGLYRMYLPTGKLDLLHDAIPGDTLPHALLLAIPADTSRIDVIYMDPEMQTQVLSHFRNYASPYNRIHRVKVYLPGAEEPVQQEINFGTIWGQEEYESGMLWDPRFDYIGVMLQKDNGIPARRICAFDALTGKVVDLPVWAEACDNIHTVMERTTTSITGPNANGYPFVYDGINPSMRELPGLSECVKGCLYYLDQVTNQIYFITDRLIYADPEKSGDGYMSRSYIDQEDFVFYVPEDEPDKLYATPKADFTQHTVVYTSEAGPITDLKNGALQYENTVLQWIEGHRQYVWFDIPTATAEVRMKQAYILSAYLEAFSGTSTTTLSGKQYLHNENRIYFYGKPSPDAELSGYIYYRDVGRCTPVHY